MNTLALLLRRGSTWSPEVWAYQRGGELLDGGQVILESQSSWLSIVHDDSVLDDYDADERTALAAILLDPTAFLIEWKGEDLLEALLRAVPDETSAVVDNDHGVMITIRLVRGLPIDAWVRASKLP